ncbi:MAG: hypothetical protein AABW67_03920 [Nanoarchaeota archaeon]
MNKLSTIIEVPVESKKGIKRGSRFQRFGRVDEPKPIFEDVGNEPISLKSGRIITADQVEPEFLNDDSEPADPIRELVSSSYEQDDEDRGFTSLQGLS